MTLKNFRLLPKLILQKYRAGLVAAALLMGVSAPTYGADCPAPTSLGPNPTRLIVVVPATGQGPKEWQSFFESFKKDPQSVDFDWLVFDHGIQFGSFGTARDLSTDLASCIAGKFELNKYAKITLIGHSVGGMLVRHAYLQSAGAFPDSPAATSPWASQVDSILLFASVNRGVRTNFAWYMPSAHWLLRTVPHPQFVLEDMFRGSDFIADIRIAWIRYFGKLRNGLDLGPSPEEPRQRLPHVVQFWGTKDSVVNKDDNLDLEAFNGFILKGDILKEVSGATHGNLQRLEPEFTDDAAARWASFRRQLFEPPETTYRPKYKARKVLIVARGIRDSSGSDWVKYFQLKGLESYDQVEAVEYGYMSAIQFASRQVRNRNIPAFRDVYTQLLAENPETEFDFIGHSNGTYILGHSLLSTPSMRFNHVVLAAPVLPTDFDWNLLLMRQQIKAARYDTATEDWPVGILCPFLNALGFSDVGPSGVVLFGEGRMTGSKFVKQVGWYHGSHGAALLVDSDRGIDNRQHLLNFAIAGSDTTADEKLEGEVGVMQTYSRLTKWITRLLMGLTLFWIIHRFWTGRGISLRNIAWVIGILVVVYVALDVI